MATKIIVGIGNPDQEYQKTRHNIGWLFLDWVAKRFEAAEFSNDSGLEALTAKCDIDGTKVLLVKPLTYVNNSGTTVAKAKRKLNAKPEDFIIAQDDLDIPFGNVKYSISRNSGGHKGVESIIKALKTNSFHRLRFGIAQPALKKARAESDRKRDEFVKDFVLKPFTPSQQKELNELFKAALLRLEQIL